MQDYELRCTEEQTIRAYKLGAPIGTTLNAFENGVWLAQVDNKYLQSITTQQMINWLREEKGINIEIGHFHYTYDYSVSICINKFDRLIAFHKEYMPYNQAELAAIDAALDYLEQKGETK